MFASRFAVDTALSFSSTRSSGSVISSSFVPERHMLCQAQAPCVIANPQLIRCSTRNTRSSSHSVTRLMAMPTLPARAVRPTRWVYSSGSLGMSQLMTMATSSMSKPRDPTSVETSTGTTNDRKRDNDVNLSRCVSREWSAVLRIDSVLSTIVRYAAVRARAQKMIVGGGWRSGSSLELLPFWLDLCFAVPRRVAVAGGLRRNGMALSGGLHSK